MERHGIHVYHGGTRYKFERMQFAGGEEQIRFSWPPRFTVNDIVRIVAHIRSSSDVMTLLLLTDALRRVGAFHIVLLLPYVPYARQDRVCAPGEALSLKVFCDLINAQKYLAVEVWDAHSDVAVALLDSVEANRGPSDLLQRIAPQQINWARTTLVAPDAGALKKVHAAARVLERPFIRADKTRDAATGEITGTTVYSEHLGDADVLIVDDICDGGRTFIELAHELRKITTGKVMLYVTHGIFSRGPQVFDGLIDRVFFATCFLEGDLPPNFHYVDPPRGY